MAAPPIVILKTDVHCDDCAHKIRAAVANMHGVEHVWASPYTGLVIVAGDAHPKVLQRRIHRAVGRPVAVVSDGVEEEEDREEEPYYGMIKLQPPPPPSRYYSGWWGSTSAAPRPSPYRRYAAAPPVGYDGGYPYGGGSSEPPVGYDGGSSAAARRPPHHRYGAAPTVGYEGSYPYGCGYYYRAPKPFYSY